MNILSRALATTLLIAFSVLTIPSKGLAAPKAPAFQLCLSANGSILAKQRCKGSEARVSADTIAALGAVPAAQGPAGPQGPGGTLDPTRCISRRTTWSGVTYLTGRVDCGPGEFLLTHGVETSTIHNDIISIALLYLPAVTYPVGVSYETGTNAGPIGYTMRVTGVCCLP